MAVLIAGCLDVPGFSGQEAAGSADPAPGPDSQPGTGEGEGETPASPDDPGEAPPQDDGPPQDDPPPQEDPPPQDDPPPEDDCAEGEVFDGRHCRVRFRQIDAARNYACGLTVAGQVRCWGGSGRDDERLMVPEGAFERLDVGTDHACVMDDRGRLTCWGKEIQGDLGKVLADTPQTQFIDFAVGTNTTCALPPGGFVECWGSNYQGQGDIEGEGPFEYLTAGGQTFCGVGADDTARCWGWQGWEGDLRTVKYIVANQRVCALSLEEGALSCWNGRRPEELVDGLPEGAWTQLALGRQWGCVLDDAGAASCFALGDEGFTDPFPADNRDLQALAVGDKHACGLRTTGAVYCWGDNADGQLDAP